MIKSTSSTNYNLKPISCAYEISEEYKLGYIDKLIEDKIKHKLYRLNNDINNTEQVFYSYMVEIENKVDKNKLDEFYKYLNIVKKMKSSVINFVESKYLDNFERLIIKPILKNRYIEFKTESDFYKYPKHITKNIVIIENIIHPYRDLYYNIILQCKPNIDKLDTVLFTNFENIKSLFPNKEIYMYKDINKVSIENKSVMFLDIPFNILNIIVQLDSKVSKEVTLYYLTLLDTKLTILDRDIDILEVYNKSVSSLLKIDTEYKSEIFTDLIDGHTVPNKFLKESNYLEVLKTWSKNH